MARTPLFRQLRSLMHAAQREMSDPDYQEKRADAIEQSGMTRRTFVQAGAASAAALGLTHAVQALPAPSKDDPFLIFGAGAAGLTLAYRLTQAGIPCEIFDSSNRAGGRIWTKDQFNGQGMFCELGGELIDTNHEPLIELAKELHLPLDDFRPSDKGLSAGIYDIGGVSRTEKELIAALKPIVTVITRDTARLRQKDGSLRIPSVGDTLGTDGTTLDGISVEQYIDAIKGADDWIKSLLKVAYCIEFGLEASEQSAFNLLVMIDIELDDGFDIFGASDEAMRIRGGNSRLIEALHKKISTRAPIHLDHRLIAIRNEASHMTFVMDLGQKRVERKAKRSSILTMPLTMLRQVEGLDKLDLPPHVLKAIREMGYGTNAKFMFGTKDRFWRERRSQKQGSNGEVFTDRGTQNFWETSRLQAGSAGIITNYLGGKVGADVSADHKARAMADFGHAFQINDSNFHDGKTALMTWATHPHTMGSYSCLKVGQYTTINGALELPVMKGRLMFAGEHTSADYSGFMCGAVDSGERLARAIVGSAKMRGLRKAN